MNDAPLNYANPATSAMTRRRRRTPSLLGGIVTSLFWCVAAVVILVLLIGVTHFTIPMANVLGPMLSLLLLVSAAEAARNVRRQRGMTIVGYLHQAVRLNLPLPTMLASAARSERGATRRRLHELTGLIQLGLPLHEALRVAAPEVDDRAVALVRAAEASGTLPLALGRLLDENRRTLHGDPLNAAFYRAYPLALALMVAIVLSIFLIFVAPKYEQMFLDFGVPLPAITVFVLRFGSTALLPITLLLLATALLVAGRSAERLFVVRSGFHGLLRGVTDRLIWITPLVGRAARDRGLADVFQALGDATHNGQPFGRAVDDAARLHVNTVLARRIERWRRAVEEGATGADGARAAGLPPLVVGLLSTARGGDHTADVLRFLARYYRSRFSRAQAVLSGALVPGVAVVMGTCVCGVAMAMFLPMIRLTDATANFFYR